jgi:Rne/Rng family ribonuclease
MNKELYVSSTPHETKVGLVEDDLLAEVYLERENEYTLAGSIYKGRVTRVLPGMQSAFVDIGLERDAFLYVSDFMELEEHDEDAAGTLPAGRAVEDMRAQPERTESAANVESVELSEESEAVESSEAPETAAQAGDFPAPAPSHESSGSHDRDRGNWRSRRRRRGGRRDRFDRGSDRGSDRSPDRGSERGPDSRSSRNEASPESGRSAPAGPPPGYEPIILPGESISKYQRYTHPVATTESQPAPVSTSETSQPSSEPAAPLAAAFPEDEPIFASTETSAEPLHEEHEDVSPFQNESAEASTTTDWNQELRRTDASLPVLGWPGESRSVVEEVQAGQEVREQFTREQAHETPAPEPSSRQIPAFAVPGTMEEETIEEEEVETLHYESSSDEGYDEFEEETQAAAGPLTEARELVSEIHADSLSESVAPSAAGAHPEEVHAEVASADAEDDSEELELEEAQAEAEAMLEAEARGNGTVDARVEVRGPSATAGYTQRAPRPAWERRSQRGRRGGPRLFRRRESQPVPLISDLLKEGQEILVQIAKEPIGKKGARITSHIALPGRFLVYMPTVNHTGVSRKISSEEERQRLKRIIQSERENGHGGFIVRTAAQNASEEELRADIRFLKNLWNDIRTRAENSKPPALIYHDLNVVERVLRDLVTSDFNVIWVDTEQEYERILRFFNRFQPALVKRVKLYTKETPLFDQFGLTEEMNKALKSKVWLKSGGYIVINQTEALVAIDINTGKYVGKTQRLEDTIVKTNVDAIKEIVRQIRLRDLGGIIIIDFIDMDERRNRQRVMQALDEELRHDRAPSKTLQFNDFGLVAITRKRVKQSLERTIGTPCPYCQATGYVKSVATICNEIYVEMRKIARHLEHEDVLLRVNPEVAKELKSNNGRLLNELEELTKRTIIVKSDPALHQEQFDMN